MLQDLMNQVTGTWVSIIGYGTMTVVLVETIAQAWQAERVLKDCRRLHHVAARQVPSPMLADSPAAETRQVQGPRGGRRHAVRAMAAQFLNDDASRAINRMSYVEQVAPSLGLGFTLASFVTALPNALDWMQNDPARLFSVVGFGAGTSLFGVACFVIAVTQRKRLEQDADQLADVASDKGTF